MIEQERTVSERLGAASGERLRRRAGVGGVVDLSGATGSSAALHGPGAVQRAFAEFIGPEGMAGTGRRGRGRPRLSTAGAGSSPKRQVRLPEELDAQLIARAAAEGRTPSAVMRDAVAAYVRTA